MNNLTGVDVHVRIRFDLNWLPLHLRLHQQADIPELHREPIMIDHRGLFKKRLERNTEMVIAARKVEHAQEFHVTPEVPIEAGAQPIILVTQIARQRRWKTDRRLEPAEDRRLSRVAPGERKREGAFTLIQFARLLEV